MRDLLLGPIIGGLSHNRAHLWGKATPAAALRSDDPLLLRAWLGQQPDLRDARLAGSSMPLTGETGFAGVAPISDLTPNSHYFYTVTLSDVPPDPAKGDYPAFTSFPAPGEHTSFSFAFGSCFRPEVNGGGDIFYALDQQRQIKDLRFILLIGDNIYADALEHNGIGKIACTLEEYRQVYHYTWSRPAFRKLLVNLPVFMTLDDHEVDDDWRWLDQNRRLATIPWWDRLQRRLIGRPPQEGSLPLKRVQDALQAYWEHQLMHAPPLRLPPQINKASQYDLTSEDPGSLAYTFNFGAAAFFVLDTRSMRVQNWRERIMLGEGQWEVLEAWLRAVKDLYPLKFLVTSCSLLYQMWLDIPQDRWSGFSRERGRLLHFLANEGIEGVYLLAGDMHSAHAVHADLYGPEGHALRVWEFCSSPFEQKPNRFAQRTYLPLRSGAVKNTRRYFTIAKSNYGVVQVDYSRTGDPRVRFELYGKSGELLAEAGDL